MRPVDADVLTEALNIFNDKENGNAHFLNGIETAKEIIADAPTIEPETVRRGKWEKAQPKYPWAKESRKSFCSLCGNWGRKSFKYCPHCGARMEREVE